MHIHTKIISNFSTTPPDSPHEFKNFLSPDIIHLSDSKELFLMCLLLFSLRLCRPTPTPPAIIILTSLCFPGLIASRIQLIFCRRASKFVKKKSAAGDKEKRKIKARTSSRFNSQIHIQENISIKNKLHAFSFTSIQVMYSLKKLPQKPYIDFRVANSHSSLPS